MTSGLCTTLAATLAPHICLNKSRLMTLAVMIVALANGRTVNLSHIASHFPGAAKHASNYRRLQRFFQHVRLDQDVIAQIVMRMLNVRRPKCLVLDRTCWPVGGKDINILMLAIVTRRFRVPLMWTLLDHRGASDTGQRIDLITRYLALFGAASVKLLIADREFIGREWMEFLSKNNVPFAIRVKPDLRFQVRDGATWTIATLLRRKRAHRSIQTWVGNLPDTDTRLAFAAKRLVSGEWLIIMTNTGNPGKALNAYKRRWAIECLFGDAKSRGLNMEDTRIVNPRKLATLLAIIALAVSWVCCCATTILGRKDIKRKAHGRREKSWFRLGLDALRKWIINQPKKAETVWCASCPTKLR